MQEEIPQVQWSEASYRLIISTNYSDSSKSLFYKYIALLFRMQLWPVAHFFHSLLGAFAVALLLHPPKSEWKIVGNWSELHSKKKYYLKNRDFSSNFKSRVKLRKISQIVIVFGKTKNFFPFWPSFSPRVRTVGNMSKKKILHSF